MRRLVVVLSCVLMLACAASAQMLLTGVGTGDSGAPAPYSGPGDAVSGAFAWYGLRGYNATYATGSNPAIDVIRASDSTTQTLNILSNGNLDTATATTFCQGTTCAVSKFYDQSGANACGGGACHLTQATSSQRPTLTISCQNGKPCLAFTHASNQCLTITGQTITFGTATIYTFVAVAQRTSATGTVNILVAGAPSSLVSSSLSFFSTANNIDTHSNGNDTLLTGVTDGNWHAMAGSVNSSSGAVTYADGASNSGNSGQILINSALAVGDNAACGAVGLGGNFGEGGFWNSVLSGAQVATLTTNERNYWGF